MSEPRTALIVGAGIGGLAAGVALGKAGWRVRIFERAATPRELGFALALAPNAILALQELGLAEAVLAQSHLARSGEARRANGAVLRRVELDISARQSLRALAPAIALRPVVHGALLAAIPPDTLELDCEGVGFETTESGVTLHLRNGRTVQGDVLIGADGIRSIVRKQLHPHEPPLRASGHCGIRGVARDVGRLGDLDGVAYLDSGIEGASVRAGETAIYWYLSLFRDDLPRDISDAAAIARQVTAVFDDQFRGIVASTAPEDLRIDELFDRDPIDDWGAGRVTLLGDAAHPMLPHSGQGAAQALEDAVALGLALSSPGDPAESLRRYERLRARRTSKIVLTGRRIALVTTTKNPLIGWVRDTAIRLVPVRAIVAAFVFMRPDDPHRELR